jgi:hypothetical protein
MSTAFPIPSSAKSGKPAETPGSSKDGSDFSIEDLMVVQGLLPKKRNDKRHKAIRLLTSGRLRVLRVDGALIVAECRGDSGAVYKLGHDPRKKQWRCTCPARTDCSHLAALWAVVSLEDK